MMQREDWRQIIEDLAKKPEMLKNKEFKELMRAEKRMMCYVLSAGLAFYVVFAIVFGMAYMDDWQPCFLYDAESGVALNKLFVASRYSDYGRSLRSPLNEGQVGWLANHGLTEDVTRALKTPVQVGFIGYTVVAICIILSALTMAIAQYSMGKMLRRLFLCVT